MVPMIQAWRLLCQHAGAIAQAQASLRRRRDDARVPRGWYVITDGDLSFCNILWNEDRGNFFLLDWSMSCLAPAERDLMFFVADRFDVFLSAYRRVRLTPPLDSRLFAFYLSRWQLDAAQFFWNRLARGTHGTRQHRHDLGVLQGLLPIDSTTSRAAVDRIRRMLADW